MNMIYYCMAIYQVISWISIVISIRSAKTDIELWGEEIE